ncbi:MAG: hypothetical protein AVDCRST_MAG18-995, partial [uncultured Thermomicrobiales bacterium]
CAPSPACSACRSTGRFMGSWPRPCAPASQRSPQCARTASGPTWRSTRRRGGCLTRRWSIRRAAPSATSAAEVGTCCAPSSTPRRAPHAGAARRPTAHASGTCKRPRGTGTQPARFAL